MKKGHFLTLLILMTLPVILTAKTYSLDECITISIQESDKIKALNEGEKSAGSSQDAAVFSFLPTMTLDAGYKWLKFKPEPDPMVLDIGAMMNMDIPPVEIPINLPTKSRNLSITAVQPITPLWSVSFGYKAAEAGHDIAKMQKKLSTDQLRLEIITLYYNYEMLSESMTVLNETRAQLKRYNEQATNFINAGLSDRRAVLKIEIEQAKIDQQIETVQGNMNLIKKNLSIFMNVSSDDFDLETVKTSAARLTATHENLEELMIKNRTELKMLKKSSEIAGYQEKIAFQPFIPTLALVAGYSKTWDPSQYQPEGTYFLGGSLSWNIGFDLGKSAFELKKAHHEKVKTILENTATRKNIELQLLQLENDLTTKAGAIDIAEKEVASATENLRIEEDKYREKLTTETELLDASIALRSAKMTLLNSIWEHEVALNRLAITIGSNYSDISNGGN